MTSELLDVRQVAADLATHDAWEPADHDEARRWIDYVAERYGEADGWQDYLEVEPGWCEQCEKAVDRRFVIGRYTLCRRCLMSRIRAGRRLEQEEPERTELRPDLAEDLAVWVTIRARSWSLESLDAELLRLDVSLEQRFDLLDLAADLQRETGAGVICYS